MLLDKPAFDQWLDDRFTTELFRLEALPVYTVDSDADNVERYLTGQPGPSWADGGQWFDRLRTERAAGLRRYRVRVLASPIGDYLRYECEWGYAYTAAAGEEIHILDLTEQHLPGGLAADLLAGDFFVADDEHVLLMRYDTGGRLLGAEPVSPDEAERYRQLRNLALSLSVPWEDWWGRHPEVRRDHHSGDPA